MANTKTQMIKILRQCAKDIGKTPTKREYNNWLKEQTKTYRIYDALNTPLSNEFAPFCDCRGMKELKKRFAHVKKSMPNNQWVWAEVEE